MSKETYYSVKRGLCLFGARARAHHTPRQLTGMHACKRVRPPLVFVRVLRVRVRVRVRVYNKECEKKYFYYQLTCNFRAASHTDGAVW